MDGKFSTKEKIRSEVLFDEVGFGSVEIAIYKLWPERIFINTTYTLDVSKSHNLRFVKEVAFEIFEQLKALGYKECYCIVFSQKAFNFNTLFGFESNYETIPEYGLEIMKKVF